MSARPKKNGACVLGLFTGIYRECKNGTFCKAKVIVKIRCGRWDCPICGPKKARRVYKRAMNGGIAKEALNGGSRSYNMKLLTLTYGGKGKRAGSSPRQAQREMQAAWEKLRKELGYLYGKFSFIKVFEAHKDGWPHLHILLSGQTIAPLKVLTDIQRLWRFKYGYGYVNLTWAESPRKALRYILKYLFKCPVHWKNARMYSYSEDALSSTEKKQKRMWEEHRLIWRENYDMARQAESLLDMLGDEEALMEIEVMPIANCPF